MVTPEEIKQIALGWWHEVLVSSLRGEKYFPRDIPRIGRIKPRTTLEKFGQIQEEIAILRNSSKEVKGHGYTVIWSTTSNRKIGQNQFPQRILFETLDDYLRLIKKGNDFEIFRTYSIKLVEAIPDLKGWIERSPELIILNRERWDDLITVLRYFVKNLYPNLYIRQLPLPVHTKFIEQNQTVIASCLTWLIPSHINVTEKTFERKFNLKHDEPLIRLRILDDLIAIHGLTDLSTPLSQFKTLKLNCSKILVTENKMCFLTLPRLGDSIAIWSGGGFNIKYLMNIEWLKSVELIYWGDIDTHGLIILDQMRRYFPHAKSILMDQITFDLFSQDKTEGSPTSTYTLSHLSQDELRLFEYLKSNNLRLEQEKIPFQHIHDTLNQLI